MKGNQEAWASDTLISFPEPPNDPVLVSMDGFGFTSGGLVHDLTAEDVDEIVTPMFAPTGFREG